MQSIPTSAASSVRQGASPAYVALAIIHAKKYVVVNVVEQHAFHSVLISLIRK